MVLGGVGIVVGLLLFFGWRKSSDRVQKIVAWIGGTLAAASVLLVILGLVLYVVAGR